MTPLDPFTQRRLRKVIEDFRAKSGQLPTHANLIENGFDHDAIKAALKGGVIEEFYVTLTNGTVVKGYKLK